MPTEDLRTTVGADIATSAKPAGEPAPETLANGKAPTSTRSRTRNAIGRLDEQTPDAMTLHTREAWQMFTGRSADASGQTPAIPGGRRFAAVLRAIWALSARDNPYADWILIRVTQRLGEIRAQMSPQIRQLAHVSY